MHFHCKRHYGIERKSTDSSCLAWILAWPFISCINFASYFTSSFHSFLMWKIKVITELAYRVVYTL